nr:hypothetical protein [Tanacetum cinerariifolium]
MNTSQAQQKAFDDALVAPADRFEFRKCNMRLKTDNNPKEATFQVVLDALALTPFYRAFLITADKPDQYTKGTRIKTKARVAKFDKKKQPAMKPKSKGLAVLSEVALTEAGCQKSKKDFHISHASGPGDGVDTQSKVPDEQRQKTSGTDERTGTPGVLDVPVYDYKSDKESWGDSDEEDDDENDFKEEVAINDDDSDDNDESDDERTESDCDVIPDPNKTYKEHDEEEEEEEYDDEFNLKEDENINEEKDDKVTKELYKDVNVNLGNKDADMIYVDQADNEIASLMNTTTYHATVIPEITSSFATPTHPPPLFFNPLSQQETPTSTPTALETTTSLSALLNFTGVEMTKKQIKTLLLDQTEGQKEENQVKMLSHLEIQEEPSYTVEDFDKQQDQEFVTGDNNEQLADKEVTKADCQVAHAEEPPSSFDELNDTSFDFSTFVINWLQITNLSQEILVGLAFNLLKGTCKSIMELEYHLEECSKATTERLDWHNPKNKPYPFDLRKTLPLIQDH